ncbi:MAG: tRNA uridine-5-carboxymethylaminomethyl(34) synthesis enzyme MnmG [Oscillospiraceae bacterium]
MEYTGESYDIAVIGGGHAGIEAGLAAARLGLKTIVFTISLDAIGNLPCNPSIGGTAKGHLVREIDALGGEMGKAADATFIQSRMLNLGKGPAVHSLRVQADRIEYHKYMKKALENQVNLDVKQAEIVDVRVSDENRVEAVVTQLGAVHPVKAAILCTGTFLNGTIHVGHQHFSSGPDGMHAATHLTEKLMSLGVELRRFKTGTPARVHKRSIDYSKLEIQQGDEIITPFSFETEGELVNKADCYIAYTNENTHQIIRDNIQKSAMYSGNIEGVGPRYCPSIEDKVVRFADKKRHQIFVEPMGLDTEEIYLQGVSTSLPEEVQVEMYRSIVGMENVKIMRNAYAIEYDCVNPTSLKATLEFKVIEGLYGAGQFNGTSGYEEAAAQGLIAGINAARKIKGQSEFTLDRSTSYIGTLIDDIIIKGCSDPYRMMTSRSEYRLILRQDNADKRLTPFGREIGLISDERWDKYLLKLQLIADELKRAKATTIPLTEELNELLVSRETAPLQNAVKLIELIKRPQINYCDLTKFDLTRPELPLAVFEQVETDVKYEGYIKKQYAQVEEMHRLEYKQLDEKLNYLQITGLRLEAREKLNKIKPQNLGQASRISGVSPADISVLVVWLEQNSNRGIKDDE